MIRSRSRVYVLLAPVVMLTAGACIATRSDIERMELTLRAIQDTSRVRQARSDELTRTLVRGAMQSIQAQFTKDFAQVSDSVRQISASVQKLQGEVMLSMHDVRNQLSTLQEGIGQSTRRLNDLKTSVEASSAPAPRPADPSAPGVGPAAGTPAAATLLRTGKQLLMTKSISTARMNFQTLIDQYPTHELVPEAQYEIAATYTAEGNRTASDSVYALVVSKYPNSEKAANALFRRARLAEDVKETVRAVALFRQVIDKYPKSDEALLAADALKKLPKP